MSLSRIAFISGLSSKPNFEFDSSLRSPTRASGCGSTPLHTRMPYTPKSSIYSMSYGASLHVRSRRVDPLPVAGQQLNWTPLSEPVRRPGHTAATAVPYSPSASVSHTLVRLLPLLKCRRTSSSSMRDPADTAGDGRHRAHAFVGSTLLDRQRQTARSWGRQPASAVRFPECAAQTTRREGAAREKGQ